MGASVGCEPSSCANEELVVPVRRRVQNANKQKISVGTQAPPGFSFDGDPQASGGDASRSSAASEAQDNRQSPRHFGGSGGGSHGRVGTREQAVSSAGASSSAEAVIGAGALSSAEEPAAFATLPPESVTSSQQCEQADRFLSRRLSTESAGGAMASQSSVARTVMAGDDETSTVLLDADPLAAGNALRDATPAELEQLRHEALSADFEDAGAPLEEEHSGGSGRTIIPEQDEGPAAESSALMGSPLHMAPPAQSAFSFGQQSHSDDGLVPSAPPEQALIPVRRAPMAQTAQAFEGYASQNPQEALQTIPPVQARGLQPSSAAASASRRRAAEDRLSLLQSGDAGSLVDMKMKVKEWQWQLKMEVKNLDRDIKRIRADELKLQKRLAAEAQKGNTQHVQQLARTIVRSRKTVARLESTKVSMNDINLQLTTCAAAMSMKNAMRVSAEAMRGMNGFGSIEDLAAAMESLQHERAQSALVEESIEEAFQSEDEDQEAALEVQKVLEEFELDRMGLLTGSLSAGVSRPSATASSAALSTRLPTASPHRGLS